jgi:phosphatidylglycerol:prolipoprotein diacylglycerol transferase
MIQELFHIGSFSVSPFGVTLVFAFLASYMQLLKGMRLTGIGDDEDASAIVFAAGVGGIVGAKFYYAILLNRDWHLLFDRSGLVWYGGFILGALAVMFTLHRRHLLGWAMADVSALSVAIGYAIGRIGCFLVGDDYGRPTDLPWGMSFPVGLPPTTAGEMRRMFGVDVPASIPDDTMMRVHPTQIYETLTCLLIWAFGLWLFRRQLAQKRPAGAVVLAVFGLLAVERFLVEILRAKDDRFFGGFTLAQMISVGVLAIIAIVTLVRRRQLAPRLA